MARQSLPPVETGTRCEERTREALDGMGLLDSPEGQACVALAAAVDSGRALMAAPAMVKELRAALDALRERAPKVKDSVDEFSAARAARRAAKTG